jgi:hypothetical protein
MKRLGIFLLVMLSGTMFLLPRQSSEPDFEELITMAKEFFDSLQNGRYEACVQHFDKTMTKLATPEKMKEVWEKVTAQVGPFKGQRGVWTESIPKYDIVYVTCEFEKSTLDIKVVFDKNRKIAGPFFVPPKSQTNYKPPSYADRKKFTETEVEVGVEGWLLPGILSLPAGDGPFPALVLVHGSGPNDRDETLGPNKPFKDIAWRLASRNIAVLRYDKRTKVHSRKMTGEKGDKIEHQKHQKLDAR